MVRAPAIIRDTKQAHARRPPTGLNWFRGASIDHNQHVHRDTPTGGKVKNQHSPWDVIVTNAGTRVAYNILRSLAAHGLRVGAGAPPPTGMALHSRQCAGRFRHPSSSADPAGFMASVREAVLRHRPAVFLPTDEDAYIVAEHPQALQGLPVRTALAPAATLSRLHDKASSVKLAETLGIPTPATIQPDAVADIETFAERHDTPLMLKVRGSSAARGVVRLRPGRIRQDVARALLKWGKTLGDCIVQEYVAASGYGVSMLFDRGQPKATFAHRRLREKSPYGGPSTLRQSVRQPTLEAHAERLLRHVGYHGVAMVEFKYDEVTGQCWFLEVNPRWWGSLALAIQSGVDFPWLAYRMANGEDLPAAPVYRTGVTVRWLPGDLLAILKQLVHRHRLPRFRDLFPPVDGYDTALFDDPWPVCVELALDVYNVLRPKPRPSSAGHESG